MTKNLQKQAGIPEVMEIMKDYLSPVHFPKGGVSSDLLALGKKTLGWGTIGALAKLIQETWKTIPHTRDRQGSQISSYIQSKYPTSDIDPFLDDLKEEEERDMLGISKESKKKEWKSSFKDLNALHTGGAALAILLGISGGSSIINNMKDRSKNQKINQETKALMNEYEAELFKSYAESRGLDYEHILEKENSNKEAGFISDWTPNWIKSTAGKGKQVSLNYLTLLSVFSTALGGLIGSQFPSEKAIKQQRKLETFKDYIRDYVDKHRFDAMDAAPFNSSLINQLENPKKFSKRRSLDTIDLPANSVTELSKEDDGREAQEMQAMLAI